MKDINVKKNTLNPKTPASWDYCNSKEHLINLLSSRHLTQLHTSPLDFHYNHVTAHPPSVTHQIIYDSASVPEAQMVRSATTALSPGRLLGSFLTKARDGDWWSRPGSWSRRLRVSQTRPTIRLPTAVSPFAIVLGNRLSSIVPLSCLAFSSFLPFFGFSSFGSSFHDRARQHCLHSRSLPGFLIDLFWLLVFLALVHSWLIEL